MMILASPILLLNKIVEQVCSCMFKTRYLREVYSNNIENK